MSLYSRFHDRFGSAGVVLGVIALVLALGGSAIAAKGALTGKQKKEVKKIAKKFAGKPGKPGAPGVAGPAGPAGLAGANGNDGQNGSSGQNGSDGQDGETPTATKFVNAKGGCNEGGVEFKTAASTTHACNGLKGENGSAWTVDGTLPPGKSLTGTWGMVIYPKNETEPGVFGSTQAYSPIDFFLPLSFIPEGVIVGTNAEEKAAGLAAGCPGVVEGVPQATAGKLCVYMTVKTNITPADMTFFSPVSPAGGVGKTGTAVTGTCVKSVCLTRGSWAVTAPPAP